MGSGVPSPSFLALTLVLVLGGCDPHDMVATPIPFQAMVGSQAFACGQTYTGLGTTASAYTPKDFRLYVSNIRLLTEEGLEVPYTLEEDGVWQHGGVALLDFEDGCGGGTAGTHTRLTGSAPRGHYHALRFTLGLPFDTDHQDASVAAAPLNVTSLFWGWRAGYKFLRIEGATTGLPQGHFLHVGSTACEVDAAGKVTTCAHENTGEVTLHDFDVATNTVVVDLAALLTGSNLDTNEAETAPGCMSEPEDADCAPIFQRLGLGFGTSPANAEGQAFFSKK